MRTKPVSNRYIDRAKRYDLRLRIDIDGQPGRTVNFSTSGILCETVGRTERGFQDGQVLSIIVHLRQGSGAADRRFLQAIGTVVRVAAAESGACRLAIAFTESHFV